MNKVLQITNIIQQDADAIARNLIQHYIRIRTQRQSWEAEKKELRNFIFATDTTTTTNSSLPWRNTTTIPKICQIRDNLLANYLDALFPNDEWFVWEGDDESSVVKEKRRIIEMYMRNKIKQSGFREEVEKCLLDYIDNGPAVGEVIWVNESHYDPALDQDVTTYVGPRFLRTSIWDHYFNPTATNYNRTPKFTRYLKNIGELKKELKSRPDLQFNEETFNKLVNLRKAIHAFSWEDINKAEGYIADGFGSLHEYLGSGIIEIIEFEGDYYDEVNDELMENRIITIADGQYVLRNIPNTNWFGRDNKVMVSWRDRPDNLYGMGPLDNLVGMQYRLDHLENFKADAMDQTIMPPVKVTGDVEPFEWGPGAQIHVPEDGDVQPLAPNAAVFQVNNEIAFILNLMEEMAGAPKQAMGIRTPGEKTAFEVQSLENAAGRIFFSKIHKFEIQFIEPVLNLMLEAAKRNLDAGDVIKVVDDDFGAATFMTITREDITAIGKLRPVGARHFAARNQLIQNLNGLFQGAIGQIILPDLSRKQLTKLLEETLGLTKYQLFKDNIAVMEQAETQRLVQQAQTQLQDESATPMEEDLLGVGSE